MSSRINIRRFVAFGSLASCAQFTLRDHIRRSVAFGSLGSCARIPLGRARLLADYIKRSVASGSLGSSARIPLGRGRLLADHIKRSVASGSLGSSAQYTLRSARLLAALRSTDFFSRPGRSTVARSERVHRAHRVDRRVAKVICAPLRRLPVTEQIQAASEPQLSRHKVEIAAIAAVVMLVSMAGVLGVLPLMPEQPDAQSSTAFSASIAGGAGQKMVPALKLPAGKTANERLSVIDNMAETQQAKAELFNAVGVNCLSLNDIKGAAASFRRALEANPDLVAAQNNMGMAMLEDGDKESARQAFSSTLKLQPNNTYAQAELERLAK